MTAADRLDQIEARANAATRGPWFVSEEDGSVWVDRGVGNSDGLTGELAPWATGEADFIAHARTDVPALVAALRAVLDLADRWAAQGTDYDEDTEQQIDDGKVIVRAIEEALS